MVIEITLETMLIFFTFVIVVFILYRIFKMIFRLSLVLIASFVFPWVAQHLGLPITGSIETGITFAIIGFALFVIYEFFNFIVQLLKILTWPLRMLFKKKK